MAEHIRITSTISQPFCWVCQAVFFPEGNDPSVIRNDHHVIPRAYGGTDGPTVSLCSADHDMLHLLAQKIISGKDSEAHALLKLSPTGQRPRLMYLAMSIVSAHNLLANDPNKMRSITVRLNGANSDRLQKLAGFYSLSKESLVLRLINEKHSELFQTTI